MKKTSSILFSALTLSLFFSSCAQQSKIDLETERPNILLIVADDLGYSDLGCFGGEIRTPHLDALAKSGMRNTAFYTAPTCSPTRAMVLSGVVTHRNGYGTMEGDWADNQKGLRGYEGHLNFDVVPFPTLLQDKGYHTTLAGKWHQAFPASNQDLWPMKRGFERSFTLIQGGAGHFSDQQKMFSFFDRTLYTADDVVVEKLPANFYSSDHYTTKTMAYIDESMELKRPFFSMLNFTAPHWPLQIPDEHIDLYKGRYDDGYEVLAAERLSNMKQLGLVSDTLGLPALTPNVLPWKELTSEEKDKSARTMEIYAAMVERLDANVGRLVSHLKATGAFENTLIIFMSDNGAEGNSVLGIGDTGEWVQENFDNSLENMGRKNSYIYTGPSWAQVSSLPFKWYKSFATEGGVRSPSIISYPKWDGRKGKINEKYLSVLDIAPTILEVAGVEHPGNEYKGRTIFPMDGVSMLSWLEGASDHVHPPEKVHCWELYGRIGVRKGKWKAEAYDAPYGSGDWELYDLNTDPTEINDLASEKAEILEELKTAWTAYAEKYNVILPNSKVAYGIDDVWRKD